MKRNSIMLTLVSLIIGALITLGATRLTSSTFTKLDGGCYIEGSFMSNEKLPPSTLLPVADCWQTSSGFPMTYLHSRIDVADKAGTATTDYAGITSTPWIEFRPAAVDWLVWSVVSAAGIGLLIYLLERAGIPTGFADKKRRR